MCMSAEEWNILDFSECQYLTAKACGVKVNKPKCKIYGLDWIEGNIVTKQWGH
jgi:hypothetical protein